MFLLRELEPFYVPFEGSDLQILCVAFSCKSFTCITKIKGFIWLCSLWNPKANGLPVNKTSNEHLLLLPMTQVWTKQTTFPLNPISF